MDSTNPGRANITEIGEILHGKKVRVQATLTSLSHHRIKNGNIMTDGVVGDASGSVKCVWFSKLPLTDLKIGNEYIFEGYLEDRYGRLALQKPTYVLTQEKQRKYDPAPLPESRPTFTPSHKTGPAIDFGIVFWVLVILGAIIWTIVGHVHDNQLHKSGVKCSDVTSIDYNWHNDVLCTRPDGSTFYTDYAGGNKYGYHFPD